LPDPNAFLRIAPDGTVTVVLAHSEMGQGMWTGLVVLLAEELDLDWSKLHVEHAPVAAAYAHPFFGMQMTGGSTSIASEFDRYRQVGAMARTLLVQAAAQKWNVPAAECRAVKGEVMAGAQHASYGELAAAARALPRPRQVTLKAPSSWTVIGKPHKRLDSGEGHRPRRLRDGHAFPTCTPLSSPLAVFVKVKRSTARCPEVRGVKAVLMPSRSPWSRRTERPSWAGRPRRRVGSRRGGMSTRRRWPRVSALPPSPAGQGQGRG
jgi:hypothetical protein